MARHSDYERTKPTANRLLCAVTCSTEIRLVYAILGLACLSVYSFTNSTVAFCGGLFFATVSILGGKCGDRD